MKSLFHSKPFILAFSIIPLVLAGCDKTHNNAPTQQPERTASTTTVKTTSSVASTGNTIASTPSVITASAPSVIASAPTGSTVITATGNTAAAATIDQIMSIMGSGMAMANKMAQQTDGKVKFTNEQIDCMMNKENNLAIDNMQSFLQQHFTKTQMQQMNDYFASTAGKKQSAMTKNMIAALVKDQKDIPKVQMTDQETKQMQAFWRSDTGKKLEVLLKDKEKLRPVMMKIMDKKQVICNFPKDKA